MSKNVLVVGDWIIDENWLVASHAPETSTHFGKEHYRSLVDNLDAQILSLCGAGNVARALHGLHDNLSVYGVGLWHPDDTKLLASLFSCDKILENETPLQLKGITPKKRYGNIKGLSLCRRPLSTGPCQETTCTEQLQCKHLYTLAGKKDVGTTRVIRVYRYGQFDKLECAYRFDWDKEYKKRGNYRGIDSFLCHQEMDAIVVSDGNRGVVTPGLIRKLSARYPDAEWYVRSKALKIDDPPRWFEKIPPDKLRLVVVGAEIMRRLSDTTRWYLGKTPTFEAIDKLKKLGQQSSKNCNTQGVNKLIVSSVRLGFCISDKLLSAARIFRGWIVIPGSVSLISNADA